MNINYELKIKSIRENEFSAHSEQCYQFEFEKPFIISGSRGKLEIVWRLEILVTEENEIIYSFLGKDYEFCCTQREFEIDILGLNTREFVNEISKQIRIYQFEKKLGGE